MTESWTVRRATSDDAEAIAAVAAAAWRDTYDGLLASATIEAFIARAYSIERVRARIADDDFSVVEAGAGIVAFADALSEPDHVALVAIYALPAVRSRGAGTALLDALAGRFPHLPIAADVLVGNRKGEVFYERRGFEPREQLTTTLFGEEVTERRWWRPPTTVA